MSDAAETVVPELQSSALAPAQPAAEPAKSAEAKPLTPYQRRKQRERENEAKAEARRADRVAKKATKTPAESPRSEPAAKAPLAEEVDEAQRRREAGGFWRLALRVIGLLMWPFGWTIAPLTDQQCAEDVALLAPLAARHRWLEVLIRYAALPYLLAERIATQKRRREPPKDKQAAP